MSQGPLTFEPTETLSEPGREERSPGRFEDLDGAPPDARGLLPLTPVLVKHGEALVAEGARMANEYGGPAVLDEADEVRLVKAVPEVRMGEQDACELEASVPLARFRATRSRVRARHTPSLAPACAPVVARSVKGVDDGLPPA